MLIYGGMAQGGIGILQAGIGIHIGIIHGTAAGTAIGQTLCGAGLIGHGTITGMIHGGVRYIVLYMHHGPDMALQEVPGIILDTADL